MCICLLSLCFTFILSFCNYKNFYVVEIWKYYICSWSPVLHINWLQFLLSIPNPCFFFSTMFWLACWCRTIIYLINVELCFLNNSVYAVRLMHQIDEEIDSYHSTWIAACNDDILLLSLWLSFITLFTWWDLFLVKYYNVNFS